MAKRLFSLSLMIILATTAWADAPTTVSVKTIWEFSSQTVGAFTVNTNINGLWLRAGESGNLQFQNLKRSGTFSDGSTWTTMTNNESGVSAYIPNNINLTPTSLNFTSYDVADGNRTRRCAALQTTVKGNFYLALYVNTSNTGVVNLYKVGSEEQSVASASNVADGATDFTGAGNTATIKYHGEPGLYVLGSKNIGFHLCYMKFVPTYIIKASAGTGGSIDSVTDGSTNITANALGDDGAICEIETSVTFTATPNDGYHFVSWTNSNSDVVSTDATYTISSLSADQTLTANFAVDKTAPTYTPPTYSALTYNGNAQNLVSAGTSNDGTFTYSTSKDGTFTDAIPQGTDAGNYTVWYKFTGDASHTDIDATEVTGVSIAKYDITNAVAATAIEDQQCTGAQITPDAPAIKMDETTIDAENYEVTYGANNTVGEGSIIYTAKNESTNFTGTKTLTFNITNSALVVTADNYEGTYDGIAHGITVTADEGATITYRTTDSGEYSLTDNPTFTNVGSYTVYYKVTKDNCEDVSGSKTVIITPAAGSINAFNPASGSVTIGITDFSVTTTAIGDGTITYSSGDESIATINATTGAVTPVAAGTTTITATATDKDGGNYTYAAESKTATYQLTVTPAAVVENLTAPNIARKDNTTVTITIGSTDSSETSVTTYYSTDGNDPSESNGTAITQDTNITLGADCTVKAITISSAGNQSSVASYNYIYVASVSETIVSTDTKWTFDELNLVAQDKVIQDLGSGLIYRGNSGASIKDNSKSGTFTDAQSTAWSSTKAIELPAASDNLDGAFTSERKANTNYNGTLAKALAFNVGGPGTCYVVFSADAATDSKSFKLFFNYKDGSWTSKSSTKASSTELTEVKLEADREGTFWIYSSQKCYVHSILFVSKKYTISEESKKSHVQYTVSPTTASAGQTITVTASPEDGYYVSSIKYTYIEGETTKTATVSTYSEKIATITKEFSMPAYDISMKVGTQKETLSLTAAQVEHGSISFKDNSDNAITTARIDDQVTVVSSPDENYTLSSLSAVDAKGNSISIVDNKFTMPAYGVTVTATFVSTTHTHSFSCEVGTGDNSNVLTATCQTAGCDLTGSKTTLTLNANGGTYNGSPFAATTDLDAFNQTTGLNATCSINYSGDNDYSSSTAPTNVGNYTATATVTIEGTNYILTKTFIISATPVTTYSITLPSEVNGNSVTANVNDLSSVAENTSVTLTIHTAENYTLANISATGVTLSGSGDTRTFTMPAANVTITATWTVTQTDNSDSNTNETYTVTETGGIEVSTVTTSSDASSITIPAQVGSTNVTSISNNAFSGINNKSNIKSVDLSATAITNVEVNRESGVFNGFPEETMIYMPAGNTEASGQKNVIIGGTCSDFVMTDEKSYNIPTSFTAMSATLSRSFTSDVTCTLCLPYAIPAATIASFGKIYYFSGINGTTIQMTEQTGDLEANTPYIFVPNNAATGITTTGSISVSMSDAETNNNTAKFTFKGVYEHKVFSSTEISSGVYGFAADADHGAASVGQFVKASNGAWTEGMRAYLEYSEGDLTGTASTRGEGLPEVLNVVLIHANGSTTNIGSLELMTADDGSPVYNLNGQRVDNSYKGLVIKNGKKVVKK